MGGTDIKANRPTSSGARLYVHGQKGTDDNSVLEVLAKVASLLPEDAFDAMEGFQAQLTASIVDWGLDRETVT